MEITVRQANKQDTDQIYLLSSELGGLSMDKERSYSVLNNDLNNPNIFYMLAISDNEAVGYICGSIEDRFGHDKKVATIRGLVVTSNMRSQGIGTMLVESFEKIANDHDCGKIEVTSSVERSDAHHFYVEKNGMTKTHYRFSKQLQ